MNVYLDAGHAVSFGTFPLRGEALHAAMISAAEIGYRSFDTAQLYQNEVDVGACLKDMALARDDVFVTTKVSPSNFAADRFIPSVEKSLADLQLDQVDMLLLHWPDQHGDNGAALDLLQQAHTKEYTKHIGISNYTIAMMEDAILRLNTRPAVNQVEFHPFLDTVKLLGAAERLGLPLSAYCAVARGKMFDDPTLTNIGAKYDKSASQAGLRWTLQKGVAINAMSSRPENLRLNLDILDFELTSEDIAEIDLLMETGYRIVNSEIVPTAPIWD
ncbi:MAG: aldo/keto reductase [Bacteroidetes bacterium]|nr:aldo/keto reductase [Bacteroidota bacterium]